MARPWSFKPYTDHHRQRWVDGQGWLIIAGTSPVWLFVWALLT